MTATFRFAYFVCATVTVAVTCMVASAAAMISA
jgi:hypothetical protein